MCNGLFRLEQIRDAILGSSGEGVQLLKETRPHRPSTCLTCCSSPWTLGLPQRSSLGGSPNHAQKKLPEYKVTPGLNYELQFKHHFSCFNGRGEPSQHIRSGFAAAKKARGDEGRFPSYSQWPRIRLPARVPRQVRMTQNCTKIIFWIEMKL